MTRIPSIAALTALVALAAAAQPVQRLIVHEAVQVPAEEPAVRVYFDVLDAAGTEVSAVEADELSATLGEQSVEVHRVLPFADTGEGIAYVFLVDVSASLSAEQFDRIREALAAWISTLAAADRAAILAFGNASRVVVDFTADRERLEAGLAGLGPTDAKTLLHRALLDAVDLGARRDPDLPSRRAAVVLSDGIDDGSGLTADDVLATMRGNPMPIYAVGFSQLPEPQRSTNLEVLLRFTSNSGGAFFAADRTDFAAAYAAIRRAIARAWVAEVTCPGCRTDGETYRLQLTLRRAGRVLSQGTDLRMLPLAAETVTAEGGGEEMAPAAETPAPRPAPAADVGERSASRWWLWIVFALSALAAAGVAWGVSRRRRSDRSELPDYAELPAAEVDSAELDAVLSRPLAAASAVAAAGRSPAARRPVSRAAGLSPPAASPSQRPASRPSPSIATDVILAERPRRVRLVVLRGSRRGREYALTLETTAVVGARSTCECVLADERDIAPRQFELAQRKGRVMIRNVAKSGPTLLNGLAIPDWQPLNSNDLVGTGETILRVLYQ